MYPYVVVITYRVELYERRETKDTSLPHILDVYTIYEVFVTKKS